MSQAAPLLVELLTEELPPKALGTLQVFADFVVDGLIAERLVANADGARRFASPRRLGVYVPGVLGRQPDLTETMKGPKVSAFFGADGKPIEKIAAGFARRCGVEPDVLLRGLATIHDPKGDVVAFEVARKGEWLPDLLAGIVRDAAAKLPVPKMMRWGDSDEQFVRPVRGLVMLHGDKVIPGAVLGQQAGRVTRGHRFMSKGAITIPDADAYEALLEGEGKVIASFDARLAFVRQQLAAAAGGAAIAADDALYREVTGLVEYPVVLEATFAAAFLEVPQECLMLTMQQNQKYFPLLDGTGKLLNRFLLVSNMAAANPYTIIRGNERVLRARLADAKFFYDQDRRRPLATLVPQLATVVFHNKLGTQLERVERIERLAGAIAAELHTDQDDARRAARLCKADLLTGMVGEFPELQGVMGEYYARHDGERPRVAAAIGAHYRPRFAGDALPGDAIGDCVALADKLDTLAGIWGIGAQPTGDKDPFALRRAALGVLRILIEHALPLDGLELLRLAAVGYGAGVLATDTAPQLHAFMLDRLRGYLRERGFAVDEIDAVVSQNPTRMAPVLPRIEAVRAFRALPDAQSLAAANKRTRNILRKAEDIAGRVDTDLLREAPERELHRALAAVRTAVEAKTRAGDYAASLQLTAQLRPEVDRFFDAVLVNAEDAAVRRNRLRLLAELDELFNQVADISRLAP